MIVIKILLGIAAVWALIGHIIASASNLRGMPLSDERMAETLIAFILALGFLGLLLK